MPALPAHVRLTDRSATLGHLRDQLSPEARDAVAPLLAALDAGDAPEPGSRRPRFVATLDATDDRALVTVSAHQAEAVSAPRTPSRESPPPVASCVRGRLTPVRPEPAPAAGSAAVRAAERARRGRGGRAWRPSTWARARGSGASARWA